MSDGCSISSLCCGLVLVLVFFFVLFFSPSFSFCIWIRTTTLAPSPVRWSFTRRMPHPHPYFVHKVISGWFLCTFYPPPIVQCRHCFFFFNIIAKLGGFGYVGWVGAIRSALLVVFFFISFLCFYLSFLPLFFFFFFFLKKKKI